MTSRLHSTMLFLVMVGIVLCAATRSEAAPLTLADNNTLIEVDPTSQAGMYTWRVDGTDNLFQNWFWYRIGRTGSEFSIDTISAPVVTGFDGGTEGTIVYQNPALRVAVTYSLTGGVPGSLQSALSEQVSVTNRTHTALDLHLFDYTDFDLAGTADDDSAIMPSPTEVLQSDGRTVITAGETVVSPPPSHHEVNYFSNTRDSLNDGQPTTLNDSSNSVGPGDVTWAFQWDSGLRPGATLTTNVAMKDAVPIPEPATMLLFLGVGAASLSARHFARRRKTAALDRA